ncbi:LysR family transcriptional regulator [Variovorax dokdonensis]|uniref:LysR family transcriptional regulator n=1 Tax=Variovorax dokdonensis TaxID=344883 RepID=A0ABT7NC90_9BURK|nr:LysR family transcriptional regulator [Variovorax dokdonensis]MDM0045490.1 LysR family transcriptional regulator [Variovorax dokdonensis]
MNLSLRQLRAFTAVADSGSFTGAARQLHLTQAAVSVLVRELESELGVRLFDRSTRKVALSDAGREFHPQAQRVLRELENAVASIGELRDKKRGLLRVAAPQLMACTLMPRVIAAYGLRFPDVRVHLVDTLPEQMHGLVHACDVELAIGPDQPEAAEPSAAEPLARRPLLRDRHDLICPPDHPLARRRQVRWSDLAQVPFIAPTLDFMRRLQPELIGAGLAPIVPVRQVSYMTTALGLVAAGLGVSAVPTYAQALVQGHGLVMRPLVAPVFFREVCVFTSRARSLSPAAQSFVDFMAEFVEPATAD